MIDIIDFHTHRTDATAALISVNPHRFDPQPGLWYSVGYHPWDNVDTLTDDDFILLKQCACHPQVLAIGETGMDRLRGATLDVQSAVFVRHLQLAANLGKPVVVHNVRCTQDILTTQLKAGLSDVTLVIHGMRANERVARTLLDAGCYLSFGHHFNPEALRITPLDRLLIETDDCTDITINDVANEIATVLDVSTDQITENIKRNVNRLIQGLT